MWVTVNGYNQWKSEYYDEDMKLVSSENFIGLFLFFIHS